jgi:hypothetical protein
VKRVLTAVWCVSLIVLSACGDGQEEPEALPTAEIPSLPAETPSATPCVLEEAETDPQKSEGTPPFAPVTDVRPNASNACPRVVFEFDGDQTPGYLVEYAKPPFSECGSGEEVNTSAWSSDAFLRVRMEPSASVDMMSEDAAETYTGPRDISLDGTVLKHMKVVCDFEAVFEWIVGLDDTRPFAVSTLADPARLVIDISGG